MRHVDDHILTIEVRGGRMHHEIECPWAATPELRRGGRKGKTGSACGLLTACGCSEDYSRTRDKLEAYFDIDLELYDWLEGYGGPGMPYGDEHGSCPRNPGLAHYEWEGEVMVIGTECGYLEQLSALGGDFYYDAFSRTEDGHPPSGKYAIRMTWFHEDFELEVLEKVA